MSYRLTGAADRPYPSEVKGQWGGYKPAKIYGRLDCPSAMRAIARGGYARHRVFFADEAAAIAAGYRPCGVCCPSQYIAWMAAQQTPGVVISPHRQRVPRSTSTRRAALIGQLRVPSMLITRAAGLWPVCGPSRPATSAEIAVEAFLEF